MSTLLSGRTARDSRLPQLIQKIKALSYVPKLAIIQVGERPDSTAYIQAKMTLAQKIGVEIKLIHEKENITEAELLNIVGKCNKDTSIQGIIVQLPLPQHIKQEVIIEAIDPTKDTDGLTQTNYKKLLENDSHAIIPATARGVKELLEFYSIDLKGKKVAVVGRSRLVGTPIALMCRYAGAEVIICHSKTVDLAKETSKADVVIVAVGKPHLIVKEHVKQGAIVIDVGISKMPDGTLAGDVDFDAVKEIASAISPVPGGVGPMTVLALFENLIDACK